MGMWRISVYLAHARSAAKGRPSRHVGSTLRRQKLHKEESRKKELRGGRSEE